MSGRPLDGAVAFVTGAARGQGRAHALRLATDGAAIIAVDLCAPIDGVPYPLATPDDLDETVARVEHAGGRITAHIADVRDQTALDRAVADGVERFGPVNVIVANAGINGEMGPTHELSEQAWQTVIDVDLTGAWHTVKAATPSMIAGGRGGSIALISSVGGAKGFANVAPYISAKHGLIGLMRSLARELAPHRIRVNTVLPTNVDTPMIRNEALYRLFRPDLDAPTMDDAAPQLRALNTMDVPWVDVDDVANAVAWLASEQARFVTGAVLPVDAGALLT